MCLNLKSIVKCLFYYYYFVRFALLEAKLAAYYTKQKCVFFGQDSERLLFHKKYTKSWCILKKVKILKAGVYPSIDF